MKASKSWRQKIEQAPPPKIEHIKGPVKGPWLEGSLLISSPKEIETLLFSVPQGHVVSISAIRAYLAQKHNTVQTCPLTTGIFLRIIAECVLEEDQTLQKGAPWWRVVRDDGSLIEKFPGYPSLQSAALAKEGIAVVPIRKKWKVQEMKKNEYIF